MKKTLWRRLLSFRYAIQGIEDLVRTQPNARFHLVVSLVVIAAGWYTRLALWEWCVVVICIALVWAAEAFNTAIEYLVDLVSPQQHPLAGKSKDAAAAAVLLTSIGAAVTGLLILGPKIWALFFPL